GLVEVKNGRGVLVTSLDEKTVSDLYEARAALEGGLARLFVESAQAEELEQLTTLIQDIVTAHERDEPNSILLHLTDRIYELMFLRVNNQVIEKFLRIVHRRIPQMRVSTISYPGRRVQSVAEFEAFAAAAKVRNVAGAEAAITEHVRNAAQVALSV